MLKELDIKRFNFCLGLGRRFYVLCKLLGRYAENIGVAYRIPLNYSPELEISSLKADFYIRYMDDPFNPYYPHNNPDSSMVTQMFKFCGGEIYINIFKNINYQEFRKFYFERYTPEIADKFYAGTRCIVPVELNINAFHIKCRYGDLDVINNQRIPLIDAMYRSDEVVEFIYKVIQLLMFSSIYYISLLKESFFSRDLVDSTLVDWEHVYTSWKPSICNWITCFSLEMEKNRIKKC